MLGQEHPNILPILELSRSFRGNGSQLVWLIVLKREPLAFPGPKLRPVDSFGAPPMFAILIVLIALERRSAAFLRTEE